MAYVLIFLLKKMWVAFAFAKATHIFSKNTCELDIVLTRAVNILTTNELVKLTTIWTTGPNSLSKTCRLPCAPKQESNPPADARSLITVFDIHMK